MKKTMEVVMNKSIYLGLSVLDLDVSASFDIIRSRINMVTKLNSVILIQVAL